MEIKNCVTSILPATVRQKGQKCMSMVSEDYVSRFWIKALSVSKNDMHYRGEL